MNYSFGDTLYMAPNDMVLHMDIINGYNNKIQTAGPDQKLGLNEDVSLKNTPDDDKSTSDNTDDSQKKDVPTQKSTLDKNDNTDDSHNKDVPVYYPDIPRVIPTQQSTLDKNDNTETADDDTTDDNETADDDTTDDNEEDYDSHNINKLVLTATVVGGFLIYEFVL